MMAKFYEQIKEGKTAAYQAFNIRPSFLFAPSSTFNCSDLGFKLLEVGGIFELIPTSRAYLSKVLLFQTPNIVANTLKKAKDQEERMFPEVKDMVEPDKKSEETYKLK